MSLVTKTYIRKPFEIEAVRITKDNMEEVAEWCGGTIIDESGKRYIKVDVKNPLTDNQSKAFAGNWALKNNTGFKIYTHKAFIHCFDEKIVEQPQQETLFETEKPAPKIHMPAGYPEPSTR